MYTTIKCGIYLIKNTINNKCYVGQSKHIFRRWCQHRYDSKNENFPLYNAFKKYGIENFDFSIITECPPEKLTQLEEFYIDQYNSYVPYGYNIKAPLTHYTTQTIPLQYQEIMQMIQNTTATFVEIGRKFNLSSETISRINQGSAWYLEGQKYPLRISYNNYDSTRIVPLLKEGYTIKNIAFILGTTEAAIQGFLQSNNLHTSDFRKRLTSNKTTYQYDSQFHLICQFNSIKEAAECLAQTETSIQFNSVLCGIKRVLNKNKMYKSYYWVTTPIMDEE